MCVSKIAVSLEINIIVAARADRYRVDSTAWAPA